MSKISSIANLLNPTAFAFFLTLAAIVAYPARALSQTPSDESNATPLRGCLSGYPNGTYSGERPVSHLKSDRSSWDAECSTPTGIKGWLTLGGDCIIRS